MNIAPVNANLISPDMETSAPSFKDALAAQQAIASGAPQIGALEPYVKTFEANYPAFNATFDKAQLYALCLFSTRFPGTEGPNALELYRYKMYKNNNNTSAAIKEVTGDLNTSNDPWTGISVDERRGYVNDAYHDILNNEVASEYKKNFNEMLDSLSRLSGPTPDQAAGIYLKYKNFLNKFYHIAEYYSHDGYAESYKKFEYLINNYSQSHNKTPNYARRNLLSDWTSDGHQKIDVSGCIWDIGGGPQTGIHLGPRGTYSDARAAVNILKRDRWVSYRFAVNLGDYDLNNAYELLGISNRQIEIYAKSAAIGHVGGLAGTRTAEGAAAFKMLKAAWGMRMALFSKAPAQSELSSASLVNIDGVKTAFKNGVRKSRAFFLPFLGEAVLLGGGRNIFGAHC